MTSPGDLDRRPGAGDAECSVQFACPTCEEVVRLRVDEATAASEPVASCPRCGFRPQAYRASIADDEGGAAASRPCPVPGQPVERCWVCGMDEFYVQKDFNRSLGLAIVSASFFVAFLVMALVGHLWGLYVLFALAAIDWVVYRFLRNVVVCYLCHTIYRGFPLGERPAGFYLGHEEKHKHLRRAWLRSMGLEAEEGGVSGTRSGGGAE